MDGLSLIAEKIISDLLPMAGDKVMGRERYARTQYFLNHVLFVYDIIVVGYTYT